MGKYQDNAVCDWQGPGENHGPASSFVIETRGTKVKRYKITVMACAECALRLQLGGS